MTFKLDISGHTTSQMMSALVYKKIHDLLLNKSRFELFEFICSIKIISGKLIIKTQKPIINSELKMYEEEILKIFENVLKNFSSPVQDLKIIFR
ncbi:MAG: hypothetical protein PHZ26_03535 [Candidatus Gracilibacteria bacterium]|nr:hypothetical protein [Candidatus Gracilibacteria bacterium]MDD2908799.1 hypothetical protein [Candidatus Gracilibacteria bacterium]